MAILRLAGALLLAALCVCQAFADESLSAESIMARVATNQDRSEKLRSQYIYQQHIRVASRKTNGKVLREETTDYHVVPGPEATERTLQQLTGRYWHGGKYIDFAGNPVPDADSTDGELVHSFREDLTDDKSKDGLARDLFPLTTEEQKTYQFRLIGEETFEGRKTYHIGFTPKDTEDIEWAGEAFIDEDEFQPIYVFSKLSRRIPFGVRTLLGTDLPGIGFAVHYRRQEDGVWFPTSLGSEFRIHVLFFFNRSMSISMENKNFERTHVESKIVGSSVLK
jgi:hypothetical protein